MWIDRDKYWVTKAKQLEPFWYEARYNRITGSRLGSLIGRSRFSTPEETADEITGVKQKDVSFPQNILMERGITLEPSVRKWYSNKIGKTIDEMGLAVPKWDKRFGTSVDGIIEDGSICEIKIPAKMYYPIITHRTSLSKGHVYDKYYHKHIWSNHYDQMQLSMAVLGATKCHYVVYLPSDDPYFPKDEYCEIILFNEEYWNDSYIKAIQKYEELIIPIMNNHNLTRIDPS